jgi:hypothetical protein
LYRDCGFTVAYRYREVIIPHLPQRVVALFPSLNHYTPLSTFSEQVEAGLSNSNFDIQANINDGDSRTGLDERGTQEVMDIMRRERVTCVPLLTLYHRSFALTVHLRHFIRFDQARLIRHNRILARNGIDPSGMALFSVCVWSLIKRLARDAARL